MLIYFNYYSIVSITNLKGTLFIVLKQWHSPTKIFTIFEKHKLIKTLLF